MKNNELIKDIEYFLKKDTVKSYQQAQLILNAAVEKKYINENSFDILKDTL